MSISPVLIYEVIFSESITYCVGKDLSWPVNAVLDHFPGNFHVAVEKFHAPSHLCLTNKWELNCENICDNVMN